MNKWAIAGLLVASSVVGSATADLSAFRKVQKEDPTAKFDWAVAGLRYAQAALAVALPVLGVTAAIPE